MDHNHHPVDLTAIDSEIVTRWSAREAWPGPVATMTIHCPHSVNTTPPAGSTKTHKRPSRVAGTADHWDYVPSRWTGRRARKPRTWTLTRSRRWIRMCFATSTPLMSFSGAPTTAAEGIAIQIEIAFRIVFAKITIEANLCQGQCRATNWNCRRHRRREGRSRTTTMTTTTGIIWRREKLWRCSRYEGIPGRNNEKVEKTNVLIILLFFLSLSSFS